MGGYLIKYTSLERFNALLVVSAVLEIEYSTHYVSLIRFRCFAIVFYLQWMYNCLASLQVDLTQYDPTKCHVDDVSIYGPYRGSSTDHAGNKRPSSKPTPAPAPKGTFRNDNWKQWKDSGKLDLRTKMPEKRPGQLNKFKFRNKVGFNFLQACFSWASINTW